MEEVKGSECDPREENSETITLNVPISDGKSDGAVGHKPLNVHHGKVIGPARRSSKGNWTKEEDDILHDAVKKYKKKCWKKIASCLPNRTDVQRLHRWNKVLDPDLFKGPWSKEEDNLIIDLVAKQGTRKWSEIAKHLPGRIGKQCRERWCNHLNPDIRKDGWTKEELRILVNAHESYGNKWSEIAKLLPGRTENSVKNRWYCSLKNKVDNYKACGSAYNSAAFARPALDDNNLHMGGCYVEVKQTLATKCLPNEEVTGENDTEFWCAESVLGCPDDVADHICSSQKNCLSRAMNHHLAKSDATLCTTGHGLPSTDNSIERPTTSLRVCASRSFTQLSSDSCKSPVSMLRTAAMNYDNMPSIMRRRKHVFAPDKVDASLKSPDRKFRPSKYQEFKNSKSLKPLNLLVSVWNKISKMRECLFVTI